MKILLNDTSVLLNLLAADILQQLADVTGWQLAICSSVREEAKKLRDMNTGEMIDIDVTPCIESGLIEVLDLSGEKEENIYVEQSMVMDDGEAMSLAIAASRDLELAVDDRKAVKHAKRKFPDLKIWGTPEILKHWSDVSQVPPAHLKTAILLIEGRAHFFPGKGHALSGWWAMAKS